MGFNINTYAFDEGINKAVELACSNSVSQVITINPEMINYGLKNEEFAQIVNNAEMVIPDGIGIKIALMINGHKADRIPGIDFAYRLLQKCAEENLPVAIIGATDDALSKSVERLKKEITGLNIVYSHNGYFKDDSVIYNELKNYSPKLILVAMGSPRQEEFIYKAKTYLSPCLMIGIGGSLDVWSGNIKRAPEIYQKLGLEWLYRTVLQPERFKRIFPALPLFLIKAIKYKYRG